MDFSRSVTLGAEFFSTIARQPWILVFLKKIERFNKKYELG